MEFATGIKKSNSTPTSMGWFLLSAFGLAQICSWGTVYYSFPQMAVAMSSEFDWSKPDVYGALTLGLLMSAGAAVPVGIAIDKGHGRNVMTMASILTGLLFILWSKTQSLLWFYIVFAGIGFLQAAVLYSAAFAIVAKYSDKSKTLNYITTLTLWGGFASTIFIPLIEWMMSYMNWRSVLVILGLINIVICAGIYQFLPRGKQVESIKVIKNNDASDQKIVRWALEQPIFWILVVCFTLSTVIASSFRFHLYPMLIENGMTGENAVFILTVLGPAQVAGRALMKLFKSRSVAYIGVFIASMFPLSFIVMILFPTHFPMLIIAGIAFGAATGTMTIIRGISIPEFLTQYAYGTINGIMNIPITVLQAFAPSIAALSWGITGSYSGLMVGLVITSIVMLVSFIIIAVITKKAVTYDPHNNLDINKPVAK